MSRWDEIKRHARRKCFYRRLLHGYGFPYITTIGIHIDELIRMLKEINTNDNQLKLKL